MMAFFEAGVNQIVKVKMTRYWTKIEQIYDDGEFRESKHFGIQSHTAVELAKAIPRKYEPEVLR
jgi:hypothetical protein